jgi:hypothetical protein
MRRSLKKPADELTSSFRRNLLEHLQKRLDHRIADLHSLVAGLPDGGPQRILVEFGFAGQPQGRHPQNPWDQRNEILRSREMSPGRRRTDNPPAHRYRARPSSPAAPRRAAPEPFAVGSPGRDRPQTLAGCRRGRRSTPGSMLRQPLFSCRIPRVIAARCRPTNGLRPRREYPSPFAKLFLPGWV